MSYSPDPTPRFSEADALTIARELYRLDGLIRPLPSERDQNFLLTTETGQFVLKIANAAEQETVLDWQHQAITYLLQKVATTDQTVQLPQPGVTTNGEAIATWQRADGTPHFVRLLTYLPGDPLATINPQPPALLYEVGHFLGWLDKMLLDFDHPAKDRHLKWDLQHAERVIKQHQAEVPPARQPLIDHFLTQVDQQASHLWPKLRCSIIHNDANDYNLLVTRPPASSDPLTATPTLSGLIDFGDVMYSYTIGELAIAATYIMLNKADPLAAVAPLIRGYHHSYPLTEPEWAALYHLICLRLCLSVTMSAHQQKMQPDNAYLAISEQPAWALLEKLIELPASLAHYYFRQVAELPPCPHTDTVVSWLKEQQTDIGPVVDIATTVDEIVLFDLSVGSLALGQLLDPTDRPAMAEWLARQLASAKMGIGRYDEARRFDLLPPSLDETPTIHLGIDLFLPTGTPIMAPLGGTIHSLGHTEQGATVIVAHSLPQEPKAHIDDEMERRLPVGRPAFFTLYHHLDRESVSQWSEGQPVTQGDLLGRLGDKADGWPAHLHFQLISDMLGYRGNFPAMARPSQRETWLSLCPNPNLILNLPVKVQPGNTQNKAAILHLRDKLLGPSLSVSYRQPLKIVRGWQQYLYDETGQAYLDGVNNVCHVGHCHPRVVQAAQQQMAVLNTNTRYLHDNLVTYAQRLCATLPDPLTVCFFVCSGSEANELALRLARAYTQRQDVIVVEGAYHGNTTTLIDISPYKFAGPGGSGAPSYVHQVCMPDPYRGLYRTGKADVGQKYASHIQDQIREVTGLDDLIGPGYGRQVGAFICESLLSCGGQIVLPAGYLSAAYQYVRQAGGVCIADEVQVGFGRVGSHFWGFELQGVIPDIVTMGKPIGNGHPLAAVVTTPEIAASFANGMEYFNTFGGNPVSCAVGLAVLEVLEEENLPAQAHQVGDYLQAGLKQLMSEYELIGDVRGAGLFIGVELVLDRQTLTPAGNEAAYIAERLRDHGILISTDGPLHNVLKIKPPLPFSKANADWVVNTLATILREDGLGLTPR